MMEMYTRFGLEFPKDLTDEEEELKSKYQILKKLKAKLSWLHKQDVVLKDTSECLVSWNHPKKCSQDDLKKTAIQIIKASGQPSKTNLPEKCTKDFKKPSMQSGKTRVEQKRCAIGEYAPEPDPEPRSVIVRAPDLSSELIHKAFDSTGEIWRTRMLHNTQGAIVTFKNSEDARLAADNLNNSIVDGKQMGVALTKKRNTAWSEIASAESKKNYSSNLRIKAKRTIHIAYDGTLTRQDFQTAFRSFGKIENIYISSNASKRPFAFVTFQFEEEAQRAVEGKDGKFINGILLKVSPQKVFSKDSSIPSSVSTENESRNILTFDELLV